MKKLLALAVILFVGFMISGSGNLVFAQQASALSQLKSRIGNF